MRKSLSIIILVLFVAVGFSAPAQTAPSADHFKALGPDKSQGGDDSIFFPLDFEAATPSRPDPNGLVFFSLCRLPPFTPTTLYSPFSPANVDAIVHGTTFTLF